jgi:hypothetical protein
MTILDIERIVTICFEVTALLAGAFTWKKYKSTIMNKLTIYLFIIVLCEIVANRLIHYNFKMTANYLFTLLVIPLEFAFFYYFFYTIFNLKRKKSLIILAAIIIFVALIFEEIVLKKSGKYFFMSLFYSISNILLLVILIHYFILLLKSEALISFKSNPLFWVCTGLLIFYLGTFPLFAMYNSLWDLDKNLFRKYYTIQFILNWLMYSLFTIAYLWGKPKFIHSL